MSENWVIILFLSAVGVPANSYGGVSCLDC
jgi:hypothetical protein